VVVFVALALSAPTSGAGVLEPEDVLSLRYATSARLSPDGGSIAYTVSVPRAIDDEPGPRYSELHVVSTRTRISRPFVTGKTRVSATRWRPDGRAISFIMRRGQDARPQVWVIPVGGGEAVQATHAPNGVIAYGWHPDGKRIFYTSTEPESKRRKKLDKLGYGFVFYEEDLHNRNLYVETVGDPAGEPERLVDGINVWTVRISPDGRLVGMGASPHNLVDERYINQHLFVYNLDDGSTTQITHNPGKFGSFTFSPDGTRVVYTAALTRSDDAVSQVLVQDLGGAEARNLTPPKFKGHVVWARWKNDGTVMYRADEGVWTTLSVVPATGGKRHVIFDSRNENYTFSNPTFSVDNKRMAFTASSPRMPRDVYFWKGSGKPQRLTTLNAFLADRDLAQCKPVTFKARDGWPVEGLLYYPVGYEEGTRYPLVVEVHGGPESRYGYSWHSSYFQPPQVLAGRGFAVFLPNYRASTGYGIEHARANYGNPAGVEFDDIADGIRYLIETGLADPKRVGLGGGSYGGFAAAWFATYYTRLVRAAVMFVGISDLVSKRGTTDIPYEELYVHSGKKLEDMWKLSTERSPIYYARNSRTATLILGGTADTRVHPSQSLELYRRMKMNDHPAVRLVQYPGEGHGNRKMPGRRDVLYRTLRWYDWFVKDAHPFDGGMPPVDLSDLYPMDLPAD